MIGFFKRVAHKVAELFHVPYDKLLHFGANVVLALFGIWYYSLGIGLSIGASVGKEYGDSKASGNKWSWGDILADMLGMGCGIAISFGKWKIIGR